MFDAVPPPRIKLAFALLAHGRPADVERLIQTLVGQGHAVAVHYDLKSSDDGFRALYRRFAGNDQVRFARRLSVHWGEWSVVRGTLNCLDEIAASGWRPDYVYHLSGMDYPIRPSAQLLEFLERNRGDEFIETAAADSEPWVKTGPQRERYTYRWWFNWRDQKRRTEISYKLQRWLGLTRPFVRGLTPYMGSQWWVLTWTTLQEIMQLARAPDIARFFRTTLVPDELFFQTMVRQVAQPERITNCPLTLYQFSDYGYPVVYHADHYDYLLRQNFFFARKISTDCGKLRDRLDLAWSGEVQLAPFSDLQVGLLSSEYEDWRLAHRDGPPGRPVAGRSQGRWYEDHKRVTRPFFAVLGSSTAELAAVQSALARAPGLLCHGQVFHPTRIEFARNVRTFAGYDASDVKLRDLSAPAFVADVVGAEKTRLSGFLLRRGQGWHIAELALDRPHVRVVLVDGDPLVAFCETLLGAAPMLEEGLDLERLRAVPPHVAALCFRRFITEYEAQARRLAEQWDKAARTKPPGWLVRIDPRHDDWRERLAQCLGAASDGEAFCANAYREVALDLLRRGGISQAALEHVRLPTCNVPLVMELV